MLTRAFLAIIAIMFAAFGVYSFMDPIGMAAGLGVDVAGPNGAYELRGIYGGVSLAAAALGAAGAAVVTMRRPALWFFAAYFGGYVFARIAALLMGPPPASNFWPFIGFEVACFVLTVVCLRTQRSV